VVLNAVSFVLASSMTQFPSAVCAVSLWVVGHLSNDLYRMADRASGGLQWLGKALWLVMPQLDRLDFKARATYLEATSNGELLTALAYTTGYSMVLVTIACLLFEKRDFK
jgi:hypothetical protein